MNDFYIDAFFTIRVNPLPSADIVKNTWNTQSLSGFGRRYYFGRVTMWV
jgi:hypothetical protein